MRENSSFFDDKARWFGVLENPLVSKIHRMALDYGNVPAVSRIIRPLPFNNFLDVCCGLGDFSSVAKHGAYVGLDNSFRRIFYASRACRFSKFVCTDACAMPFQNQSFDLSLFAGSAHHFSDEEFFSVILEMKRVSRKHLVVADIALTDNLNKFQKFIYHLDRGKMIRHWRDIEHLLARLLGVKIESKNFYRTFPGIYCHVVFVLGIVSEEREI